ncbi:hypothetical protein C2G38_2292882 [Gigaspora rosea]|uniref:Uncharacterized protein n=1 Tax=Gigaspora rosea TaxID=44941 RepID=A0A397TV76_9GLOM|nr:hypothetical protein C2G38_2292882 [Gigaspora rosea]
MITEFQRNFENQEQVILELRRQLEERQEVIVNLEGLENAEKIFKRAMAVDSVYGSRHGKYVSEINLVASAIKYSIARSKTIINIDNHFTSSGSYFHFQNWLEELSDKEEALPEGLLFLAFDNEQWGQRNYFDRGHNTVIFHTVTSFVAFNIDPHNYIQHTNNKPWAFDSLNRLQYKSLFDPMPKMQDVIDKELHLYFFKILDLLCEKILTATNKIDSLASNLGLNIRCSKQCPNCKKQDIDNRKQVCPDCKFRLPTYQKCQKC